MTHRPTIDMALVTRLTRQGRLREAMALLRAGHGLPGGPAAGDGVAAATSPASDPAAARATLDLTERDGRWELAPEASRQGRERPSAAPSAPTDEAGATGGTPAEAAQVDPRSRAARLANVRAKVRAVKDRVRAARPDLSAGFRVGARAPAEPEMPAGARFEQGRFALPDGNARRYRLYVPAALPAGPRPLIVMLHGCTQTPEDFAAGTRMNALAEEFGLLVLWPAQERAANPQACWSWFRPADQRREAGEAALIAGMTRAVMASHAVDPARVAVAGLSAGGAMAAVLGRTHPELYGVIGVHSGLPAGAARTVPGALDAMKRGAAATREGAGTGGPRVLVLHGLADNTVTPRNGERVVEQALSAHALTGEPEREEGMTGRRHQRRRWRGADGRVLVEHWTIDGAGHAWAGGHASGSYADPAGPDASRALVAFLLER